MNIGIAIITAPRKMSSLEVSFESLRNAGVSGHVYIFAEPESNLNGLKDCTIFVNKDKMGHFRNYDQALSFLCEHYDHVIVLSDDLIYNSRFGSELERVTNEKDYGYYAFFTHSGCPSIKSKQFIKGWNELNVGLDIAWGGAYLMEKEVAAKVVVHEIYNKVMIERNQQTDGAISEVMLNLGLPMYYHNPSFICTIGHFSTIGHKSHYYDGLNFES